MKPKISDHEILKIVEKARAETPDKPRPPYQTGGWTRTPRAGRAYWTSTIFDERGSKWVACRGPQRKAHADLLDATACFMASEGVMHAGVAILDSGDGDHVPLNEEEEKRLRRAAWHGLGILWCAEWELDRGPWSVDQGFPRGDFDSLVPEIEKKLRAAAVSQTWGKTVRAAEPRKRSQRAEELIRPILDEEFDHKTMAREIRTFWRSGHADGAWLRAIFPQKIGLEVKVDEDTKVPFVQIIDDLRTFDAVIQVRLIVCESKRRELLIEPTGRSGARERLVDQMVKCLPVKTVEICFCSDCGACLPSATKHEPLTCKDCQD